MAWEIARLYQKDFQPVQHRFYRGEILGQAIAYKEVGWCWWEGNFRISKRKDVPLNIFLDLKYCNTYYEYEYLGVVGCKRLGLCSLGLGFLKSRFLSSPASFLISALVWSGKSFIAKHRDFWEGTIFCMKILYHSFSMISLGLTISTLTYWLKDFSAMSVGKILWNSNERVLPRTTTKSWEG